MLILNDTNRNKRMFAFIGKDIILRANGDALTEKDFIHLQKAMPYDILFSEPENDITAIGILCKDKAGNQTASMLPTEYTTQSIRLYNVSQTEENATCILRAKGLMEWLRETNYCLVCGTKLTPHKEQTAMVCPDCGKMIFPRIEPCIIVLVRKGDKMLLARHVQRNQDIYACIAGFMETGETAEQAVRREIMEETGLTVKNIRYFGSQSWPFTSQLMIAFTAEYESGELNIQESEIKHAAWFAKDECPAMPQPGSIAHRMIHSF